jgi:hypothetical protein
VIMDIDDSHCLLFARMNCATMSALAHTLIAIEALK